MGENIAEEDEAIRQAAERIEVNAIPNLTFGETRILVSNTIGNVKVMVYNKAGRLINVGSAVYNEQGIKVDLSDQLQGPYYIKVLTERGSATTTIIKM